jgi:hypothetical protein
MAKTKPFNRRGVASIHLSDTMMLVNAPFHDAAEAFAKHAGAKARSGVKAGSVVKVTRACYLAFQISGVPWMHIGGMSRGTYDDARTDEYSRQLSGELGVPTISYSVSDTAGTLRYGLFEDGELTEFFESGADGQPERALKALGKSKKTSALAASAVALDDRRVFGSLVKRVSSTDLRDKEKFANAFFKRMDAFVPTFLAANWEPGADVTLRVAGVPDEFVTHMEYLIVR